MGCTGIGTGICTQRVIRISISPRIRIRIWMDIVILMGNKNGMKIGVKMKIMIGHGKIIGIRIETRMGTGMGIGFK